MRQELPGRNLPGAGTPDMYLVHLVFFCHMEHQVKNKSHNSKTPTPTTPTTNTNHQQDISTWLICNSCRASAKKTGYLIIGRWIGEVSKKVALFSLLNNYLEKLVKGRR